MKKIFNLSQAELELLESLKNEFGYRTDIEALRHIFRSYKEKQSQEDFARLIADRVEEKFRNDFVRIRLASRTTEENTAILLDVANTVINKEKIDNCILVDVFEDPLIETSREHYREKIAYYKQLKDNRKK